MNPATSVLEEGILWHGKIVGIFAHVKKNTCLQILVKVQWYDILLPSTATTNAKFYLMDKSDIIQVSSIVTKCLAISYKKLDSKSEENCYYLCTNFSKYYNI